MKKILIAAIALCMTVGAIAQNQPVSLSQRAREAKAAGGAQLEAFKTEIAGMLKGNDEMTYLEANSAYNAIGEKQKADEVMATIKKKFPKGIVARNDEYNEFTSIKSAAEMEKAYQKWLKKFPKEKMGENITYDYAAYSVANQYAKEGNGAKALELLKKVQHKTWRVSAYMGVGRAIESTDPETALKIYEEGAAIGDQLKNEVDRRQLNDIESLWNGYGSLLYKNGNKEEALKQFEKVSQQRRGIPYAKLQNDLGHPMPLFVISETQIRQGRPTADTEDNLKSAWEKANGNLDGCDDFIRQLKDTRAREQREEILKSQISEKAPDFTIVDVDGKKVSLSDFNGKTVILDFWATWCGPCKASFPAMKRAVEQYKNDESVVFLFIHTWERGSAEDATKDAKEYLAQNGYDSFTLLMDTKDPETKKNPAVSAYGVTGIPAKFIIDPEGNIRYKIRGFSGNDDEAVAELSIMIESLKPNVRPRPRR